MPETNPTIAELYGYAQHTLDTETDPPDVAAAPPDPPIIRDRSATQPWLPVEKTTWDNWRFMLRARRVRVGGPDKLKLKPFYLAMAGFTDQLLKGVDIGKFALPIHVILFDLQLAENTFYKLRGELRKLELLDWKQRRNRSTEYRVFTRREWAAAAPNLDLGDEYDLQERDPWIAAGVSRATWYRDRARTEPKTTHGGARQRNQSVISSGPSSSGTPGSSETPNRKGCGSSTAKVEDVRRSLWVRTKSTQRAVPTQLRTGTPEAARARCPKCPNTWPAERGTACHKCGYDHDGSTTADADARPLTYSRIRNCPQCHADERGADDTCQRCSWTRDAWDARPTDAHA